MIIINAIKIIAICMFLNLLLSMGSIVNDSSTTTEFTTKFEDIFTPIQNFQNEVDGVKQTGIQQEDSEENILSVITVPINTAIAGGATAFESVLNVLKFLTFLGGLMLGGIIGTSMLATTNITLVESIFLNILKAIILLINATMILTFLKVWRTGSWD